MRDLFLRVSLSLSSFLFLSFSNSGSVTANTSKIAIFQQSDWGEVVEARDEFVNETYHAYVNHQTAHRNGEQVTFDFMDSQRVYYRTVVRCDTGLATPIRVGEMFFVNMHAFPKKHRFQYKDVDSGKWTRLGKSPIIKHVCNSSFAKEKKRKSENYRLKIDAIGGVRVGMTIDQLLDESGGSMQVASTSVDEACLKLTSSLLPSGLEFMTIKGKLSGFSVSGKSKILTLSGLGIGDNRDKAFALYPRNLRVIGQTRGGGELLAYVPSSRDYKDYRLVLETSKNGEIRAMRSGKIPEVYYQHGCSEY